MGKHKETIKRWIRAGKFSNAYRNSDKEGWRIPEGDLRQLDTLVTAQEYKQIKEEKQSHAHESTLVKLAYEAVTLTSPIFDFKPKERNILKSSEWLGK